jgi:hypothetical protein
VPPGIHFAGPDATTEPGPDTPCSYTARGRVTRERADLGDLSLWLETVLLAEGTELHWGQQHGEEAMYLTSGAVEVDGRPCPAGGAVVVEAGATPTLRASAPTRLVHVGRVDAPPDRAAAEAVPASGRPPRAHVVGPGGTHAREEGDRCTRFFADSDCDGCSVTLFTTGRSGAYTSAPHSHSAVEILHVLEGEIVVGRRRLGPGSSIGVAADRRYGFRSDGGFTFLNYRPGPSRMVTERGSVPVAEGARAHRFPTVDDPLTRL